MINRELIRSKVVQICYSFAQNEGRNPKVAEQELSLSFSKAYEMYILLLLLLTEVGRVAERMYDVRVKRAVRLGEYTQHNPKFVQNRFIKQLERNKTLLSYRETLSDDFFNAEYERNIWSRIEN
ncbi:MAG: transcription antitermination factor NusB, partial [Bacteroidaceae bacterium]|nr:transcription antitermination factor NusB [Bacteroidaceae bacterium]